MDRPVMVLAEQDHVREVGLAALGPVNDVVRRTPRSRALAAGPAAVLVTSVEQTPRATGDHALRPPGVDDGGVRAKQNPGDRAVACESLHRLCRDGQRERHLTCGCPDQGLQGLQCRGDLNVRAYASMLRNRPGVEAVSGQLNQRVGGPAFAAPVIAVAMGLCEWFECRPDGRARCRVERPLDIERSIITVGQPQVALLGGLALSVGHTRGFRTMPGVHRVIPEAAYAVFPGGLQ